MPKAPGLRGEYVRPTNDGAGAQRGGSQVPAAENKIDAIRQAKQLAKATPLGQVVIRKLDGKIETEHTYGVEPRRHKG